MKTVPIVPAVLAHTDDGLPCSALYGDIYHPRAGAITQAQHVFLGGNQLPERWQGRERFTILETGFGLGHNFLTTWHAWRQDPQRSQQLVFISIERHPLSQADLAATLAQAPEPLRDAATQLVNAWPPLTHNLHSLQFDEGRVRLLLALGDVQTWLPELVTTVDAFYLDGFAPATNPQMWSDRVCKALGRLAAPGATLATWTAASAERAALTTAGFEVTPAPGAGGKRDITLGRYAPRFTPRLPPARHAQATNPSHRHALIVGAGLAGCAAAWALAEQGWHSTVIDRQPTPAAEGSGNAAGLFHGTFNPQDGTHARFNRAASFAAHHAVRLALERHGVKGSASGLLRLENELTLAQMQAVLTALGLPPDYVEAMSAARASDECGLALQHPAWWYPHGGWVQPAGLARSFIERAGSRVALRMNTAVQSIQASSKGWVLLDARGQPIDESPTVVIASAGQSAGLLNQPDWPLQRLRGQISAWPAREGAPATQRPVAGSGYLLPAFDGTVWFGATSQADDNDASVRISDHQSNLAQLSKLLGQTVSIPPETLNGRTAWRCSAIDRLPLIGALPDGAALREHTPDQARLVPRLAGLYAFSGLGSRGITWSALGAQVLAALISGAPIPLEASLLDAVDPARFGVRGRRH